ncbi:phospholipase B1, membrane-associated isoform X2 [Nilaparvata lugens]|uniref:phospholipase B1, membrane-associated isoform X2 n=1 Tax=Nilaparvata lugens TaxID=108931 RepID=UPI00193CEA60|nr:phospholipase B1, membrane-associated isoform X2 [Nilaparvata lugens]
MILKLLIVTSLFEACLAASKYKEDDRIVPKFLINWLSPQYNRNHQRVLDFIHRVSGYDPNNFEILQKTDWQQVIERFPCNTTGFQSPEKPTSVHRLMPGDIDVVGCLGDSLLLATGGLGTNVIHTTVDNRGIAWALGGQGTWRNVLTIANILREYNPNLVGYSYGDSTTHARAAQFNVAEIGAISQDLVYQAGLLVKRMRSDPRVDFENHWKLVFMQIGNNDYCTHMCYKNASIQPELHRRDLTNVFNYLRKNMPRALVALVINPHLDKLLDYPTKPACLIFQTMVCSCFRGFKFARRKKELYQVIEEWRKVQLEMASDPQFTTDTFAVIPLRFGIDAYIPTINGKIDFSYMAADCFHFSQKGNAALANAAWNNLIQPVEQQQTTVYPAFERFECPSSRNPYLTTLTNKNNLLIS